MTNITLTGNILSMFQTSNALNILLVDRDNPKNTVYKVALWESDGDAVTENLTKGDEITVTAKVYGIDTNQYGKFIDLRMCKLVSMAKIQRTVIEPTTVIEAEDKESLPQE